MNYSDFIILIMELIGTVAFAVSGATVGIQKEMDLFGVNVLGITTAVGGGLIRDLILSAAPPAMFRNKIYTVTAILTSTLVFVLAYIREKGRSEQENRCWKLWQLLSLPFSKVPWTARRYDRVLFLADTIGLGIFTVMGGHAAIAAGYENTRFLVVFVGVLTGVGGGVIRDVLAGSKPYILVKHIYAVASLAGAIVYTLLLPYLSELDCMMAGAMLVLLIRFLAAHYRWNLPHIPYVPDKEQLKRTNTK